MTIKEATQQLVERLRGIYDEEEANTITDWVMEEITGKKRVDRILVEETALAPEDEATLGEILRRLMNHEPAQYVLGETWFYGFKLKVDKNVLIPRPETEELVDWIVHENADRPPPMNGDLERNYKIIDIGTGSGCIAIALRKNMPPHFEVWACDTSDAALSVARRNADELQALVDFIPMNFLDAAEREQLPQVDIIVSNPPYIPLSGKNEMADNVVKYEPQVALFVPDNDPLVFYRAIAGYGKEKLQEGGALYVEIHESLGDAVCSLFRDKGFGRVEMKKDMQGKNRMICAKRS